MMIKQDAGRRELMRWLREKRGMMRPQRQQKLFKGERRGCSTDTSKSEWAERVSMEMRDARATRKLQCTASSFPK